MSSSLLQKKNIKKVGGKTRLSREKESSQAQILIAESEDELLSLFKSYLSSLGKTTKAASSGYEALEYFQQSKEKQRPYDAILIDTHLSDSTGLDLAKRIRTENPNQKIVLVTTTPKKYLSEECLRTAAIREKDILTMPFKLEKLAMVLRN